jgi:hypothetical protein
MEQNTESSCKDDSEYTLKYFQLCSVWGPLEKTPEKKPRIIYLKIYRVLIKVTLFLLYLHNVLHLSIITIYIFNINHYFFKIHIVIVYI